MRKVVSLKDEKTYSFAFPDGNLAWWFPDSRRILSFGEGYSYGNKSTIGVIDSEGNSVESFKKDWDIDIESPPVGNEVVYEQQKSYSLDRKKDLIIFNVESNLEVFVAGGLTGKISGCLSPNGNKIAFLNSNNPEKVSINIAIEKE